MPDRTFQTSPTRCDGCAHVAAALSVAGSITVADANIGASEFADFEPNLRLLSRHADATYASHSSSARELEATSWRDCNAGFQSPAARGSTRGLPPHPEFLAHPKTSATSGGDRACAYLAHRMPPSDSAA